MQKSKDPIFLSIVSGKGGVGKSTVSVNLAVSLAEKGMRVGLVDADIYGFSIPSLMDAREEPATVEGKMKPVQRFGVQLMSAGFLRGDNQPVIMRGPMLGRVIRTFLHDTNWGELDYLLFDMPPGTGDIPLDLHELLGSCRELVVTTPHETASEVAFRAGAMTSRTGHDIVGVIENMSYIECPGCERKLHVFGEDGGARLAASLQTRLLAQLPIERNVPDAPAPGVYPAGSACGLAFRRVAEHILALDGYGELQREAE